jgi:hypothetical protein
VVIDLEHRTVDVMTMLVLPAPDPEQVVERNAGRFLPEGQHGLEVVGRKTDVDTRFGEFHRLLPPFLSMNAGP